MGLIISRADIIFCMNNDRLLDDLKQFIDARLSQSERSITDGLKKDIERLRDEMHDGFSGVAEAVEDVHNRIDEAGKRPAKLEHPAAA